MIRPRTLLALSLACSAVACTIADAAAASGAGLATYVALLESRGALTTSEASSMLAAIQELEAGLDGSISREEVGIGAAGILAAALEVWRRKRRAKVTPGAPAVPAAPAVG